MIIRFSTSTGSHHSDLTPIKMNHKLVGLCPVGLALWNFSSSIFKDIAIEFCHYLFQKFSPFREFLLTESLEWCSHELISFKFSSLFQFIPLLSFLCLHYCHSTHDWWKIHSLVLLQTLGMLDWNCLLQEQKALIQLVMRIEHLQRSSSKHSIGRKVEVAFIWIT